jgi:hypothetical protein
MTKSVLLTVNSTVFLFIECLSAAYGLPNEKWESNVYK